MKKISFLLLVVVFTLGLVISCAQADDLAGIQSAGILNFGTASDYVPFVYMNGTELDGLDVAMVKEIGARLGVEVNVIDMAFDGLFDALAVGQVDLIGGALSVTDERREKVDFTNPYYEGKGIVICLAVSDINESNIAGKRVGVQRGTVYEQWVDSNLLMGGHISPENLSTFKTEGLMISALKAKDIDIAIIDEDVYLSLYKSGNLFKVMNDEIGKEKYAYAAQPSSTLIPAINTIFHEMIQDGTAQEIANKYFSMDFSDKIEPSITRPEQIRRPDTAEPVNTQSFEIPSNNAKAHNTPNCYNAMQFVSDASIPDGTKLATGMEAAKTWTIRNTGTCSWDTSYSFGFVKGDLMGQSVVSIDRIVAPNETYNVTVPFITPATPGRYTNYWQMTAPSGAKFGQTIWCSFTAEVNGSYDQKAMTGSPKIYKWNPSIYESSNGTCPIVYWEVGNANYIEFLTNDKVVDRSTKLKGSMYICPPKKTGQIRYAIRACGDGAVSDVFIFDNKTKYNEPAVGQPGTMPRK